MIGLMPKASDSTFSSRDIQKKHEFAEMLTLIREEYLYSTGNLASALKLDRATITRWKELPEAIEAYKEAVKKVLKLRRRGQLNTTKVLKELDIETEPDSIDMNLKVIIEDFTT